MTNFEDTFSYLLAKISAAHGKLLEKAARRAGLHSGQAAILVELWKEDGQRQVDLAAKLGSSPPTVNKILGGLLGNDFVTRARYEDDARSTRIFLTKKGRDVRRELEDQWKLLDDRMVERLTESEVIMLRLLLTKLVIEII